MTRPGINFALLYIYYTIYCTIHRVHARIRLGPESNTVPERPGRSRSQRDTDDVADSKDKARETAKSDREVAGSSINMNRHWCNQRSRIDESIIGIDESSAVSVRCARRETPTGL
jgi:hypothetical protein